MQYFTVLPQKTVYLTIPTNKNDLKIIKRVEQAQKVDARKSL